MLTSAALALTIVGFCALVIARSIRLAFRAWDHRTGGGPGPADTGEGE
jgi:hypothetical protein